MPSSEAILTGLETIANAWRLLAIGWHVLLATLLLALLAGWRPPGRQLSLLLATPFLSVSALAWTSPNPFNGTAFALVVLALWVVATGSTEKPVRVASPVYVVPGVLLVAFGWTYPHFLAADSWSAYLYSAPLGLLPCPTLAAVIGVTLMLDMPRSKPWSALLALTGLVYGAIGVFKLGVELDYGLLAGATLLAGALAQQHFCEAEVVGADGRSPERESLRSSARSSVGGGGDPPTEGDRSLGAWARNHRFGQR